MIQLRSLIVGSQFKPGARAVLAALLRGTNLALVPEPDNPHDPNAIAVLATPTVAQCQNLPNDVLQWLDEANFRFPLGFLPRRGNRDLLRAPDSSQLLCNADLANSLAGADWSSLQVTLDFGAIGDPRVLVTI